jgi:amino acid adenylation domain-containing protein
MASREYPELQGLLGYFQNTVVLRNHLSGSLSFRELLRQVRDVVLEAHAHQDIPFEYLVKELQPDRLLGQNPLFRTMIVVEPTLSLPLSGWTLTSLNVQKGTAKFDLFLNLEEHPDCLVSWFEYSTELFETTTIARIAQHLQTLLEGIVASSEQSLSELPLLPEEERRRMLVEWNATDKDYGRVQCVHTLFEEQVERTPNAVAVIFEGKSLTYRELDARANQLAHYLQQQGVQPDALVGVCMERSFEMVISLFAILKAGGAYVPLDPGYPLERLVFMLHDASMPLVLTQERFKAMLASQNVQTFCVDSEWQAITEQPSNPPSTDVQPHSLAYMIYTSGSTGRPKGAMNEHRGICNRLLWMQDAYGLQEGEAVMQKTPFSFDVSVWEFFWPLLVGARLVVARPEGHRDSAYLVQLIQEQQITTLHFVPSMLRFFLEERNVEACRSLKRVICSGEALPYDVQQSFFERLSAELHNLYGPTEAAVDVSAWACERDSVRKIVPIGKPIANLELYVLDAHLQPVPIGVTGELYIGGIGVGRGYLNRPELTRERFIPDPFKHRQEGDCLYKTGDVVRYLPDGNIEYLGRADQQVKLRGQRIELGEIEAVLDLHPAIREAVVVAQKESTSDMRLVAYVSFHKEQEASTTMNDLHNYMKTRIPVYMIPSAFVVLPTLPLLPNGKVNRQALPKADVSSVMKEEEYVAPVSLTEHQLVQIWEELLKIHPIGIRNNFFYLGGNSLLAVRLVSKIEQSFGRKLPSAVLFAQPTIEQLAAVLQAEERNAPVIGVSTTGTKLPFFYLPGTWNTGAAYCFSIARHLGPDQPFYVVEPPYFDDFSVAPTVKMTAKAHIESIQAVQPEGPYQLGGFCNGALVAYEMARQLRSMGEEVKLLVLIDPAYPPMEHMLIYNLFRYVGGRLSVSRIRQLDWFLRLRHMYKYIRHERNEKNLEEFTSISPDIHSLFPSRDALRKDNIAIFNWLIADYNYTTFEKATLVRAAKEPLGRVWRKLAKQQHIKAHVIAGDHISCRTDHVDALAEELKRCLDKSVPTRSGPPLPQ